MRKIKKGIISVLLLSFILAISIYPVSADEIDYIPIKIMYSYFDQDVIGSPLLTLAVVNSTTKNIDAFEFDCKVYDTFDRPVYRWGTQDNTYKGIIQNIKLVNADDYTWNLAAYSLASKVKDIKIKSVHFTDGTTWIYNPSKNYRTEAEFKIVQEIGEKSYNITDATGISPSLPLTVTLFDFSYSATSWQWYIWNDGVGWVLFSNDSYPDCVIWGKGATIKLVINNNPCYYKIHSVNVNYYTNFEMQKLYTEYSWQDKVIKSDSTVYAESLPYTFKVVDKTEFVSYRAWYIWSDDSGWVYFSGDKVAECTVWKNGATIKLVINGDESNYQIQNFQIKVL